MSIFKRLDRVSIGVHDLEKARRLFVDVLGGEPLRDAGTSEAESFQWTTFKLGSKKVELVAPTTPGEGGVGRYLARHGEGFHHLSIAVENLADAIKYFESHGLRILAPSTQNPDWKHYPTIQAARLLIARYWAPVVCVVRWRFLTQLL